MIVVPLSTSPKPSPPLLVPVNCDGRNEVAVIDQNRREIVNQNKPVRFPVPQTGGCLTSLVSHGVNELRGKVCEARGSEGGFSGTGSQEAGRKAAGWQVAELGE